MCVQVRKQPFVQERSSFPLVKSVIRLKETLCSEVVYPLRPQRTLRSGLGESLSRTGKVYDSVTLAE